MTAPKTFTKTTAEIQEVIAAYYAEPGNAVGGHLHMVLDDGNVDDGHLAFCRDQAEAAGDAAGVQICDLLMERGRSTRRRIVSAW